MQENEGVIKYNGTWIPSAPLNDEIIRHLNEWRDKLYHLQLVGENQDGIGYGNVSMRYKENSFVISGSGTGGLLSLSAEHYTLVTDFSIAENSLTTVGPIKASSESLTHAAIYASQPHVHAVLHVHHYRLWEYLMQTAPSTNKEVAYGTPAMAREIERLIQQSSAAAAKLFAMGGHEEGVIAFGNDLDEAGDTLLTALSVVDSAAQTP
jgi:L-ribulose-5-phosphate 4-epimerase